MSSTWPVGIRSLRESFDRTSARMPEVTKRSSLARHSARIASQRPRAANAAMSTLASSTTLI